MNIQCPVYFPFFIVLIFVQYIFLIYTMQNKFSYVFCMCQIHHIRYSVSHNCIQIQAPITREGILRTKIKNKQMQHCTSVTPIFKTSGRTGQFEFFLINFYVCCYLVPTNINISERKFFSEHKPKVSLTSPLSPSHVALRRSN